MMSMADYVDRPRQSDGEASATLRHSLGDLTASDVAGLGKTLLGIGQGAATRQEVAERITQVLYDSFRNGAEGKRACVLVRCFQTAPYAGLPLDYQDAADRLLELAPSMPDLRCLALLSTRGERTIWNDAVTSARHQAIPLPSVEVVRHAPMITRLLEELGMPLERVVAPPAAAGFLLDELPASFNVFHVPQAEGSPFIPAQEDFVVPFGVRSVVGLGGMLPDGELFVVLLFARVPVSLEVATLFRALAPCLREALLPFGPSRVFAGLGSALA